MSLGNFFSFDRSIMKFFGHHAVKYVKYDLGIGFNDFDFLPGENDKWFGVFCFAFVLLIVSFRWFFFFSFFFFLVQFLEFKLKFLREIKRRRNALIMCLEFLILSQFSLITAIVRMVRRKIGIFWVTWILIVESGRINSNL